MHQEIISTIATGVSDFLWLGKFSFANGDSLHKLSEGFLGAINIYIGLLL